MPGKSTASNPRLTSTPGRAHGDLCPYRGHRLRIPHDALGFASHSTLVEVRSAGALDARELRVVAAMCTRPGDPPRTGGTDANSDTRSRDRLGGSFGERQRYALERKWRS